MPLTLDVRDLALVTEVAGTGSVTRASARLHLTQSALSHRLRAVESRLGTALFLRLGKKMVATPAGERVLATAQRVLDDLGRAENDVRVLAKSGTGVLRLCTQCYTGYHWLPPLLRDFNARHPGVDVQISVDATHRPVDALLAHEIDLAIVTVPVEDPRLNVQPLFEDEMLAVVAPGHSLSMRSHIEPSELASEHLLLYRNDRRDNYVFTRILTPAGVEPARVSKVPLTEAILEMVKAGLGVAILARWAVEPALDAGTVKAVRITRRGIMRQWSAATLRARPEPRWQADFIAMLRTTPPGAQSRARVTRLGEPESLQPQARPRRVQAPKARPSTLRRARGSAGT
jgi:LysR family transcriptional regulator, regulator for metE and metH